MVTQKSQYALRALFELAKRWNAGFTRIEEVAKSQAIPQPFLEVVLNELKREGLVEAKRGPRGGYQLARPPRDITVAQVIVATQGPFLPVDCLRDPGSADCSFKGDCVFVSLWEEVQTAVMRIYEATTLQDLVDREEVRLSTTAYNYAI